MPNRAQNNFPFQQNSRASIADLVAGEVSLGLPLMSIVDVSLAEPPLLFDTSIKNHIYSYAPIAGGFAKESPA